MTCYKNKEELIDSLITPEDVVLDVGFWGQGTDPSSTHWVHNLLRKRASEVWGIDMEYDATRVPGPKEQYAIASAESFKLPKQFDVVFAGDLIEHLSNPGLFLDASRSHLTASGRLILTTPSAFNLFNLAEKLSKDEPTVNPDHTCYFNRKTLAKLLQKNGWKVLSFGFVYSLELSHKESWKKKFLNGIYRVLSWWTPKFLETLVIVATPL